MFSSLVNEWLKKEMKNFQVDSYEATWRNIDATIFMSPSFLTDFKVHCRGLGWRGQENEEEAGKRGRKGPEGGTSFPGFELG